MKIYCANTQIPMAASQQVNKLGKYLYKHLDGAYDFKKSGNTFDIYSTLLYQLNPAYYNSDEDNGDHDVQEMTINISITTYQNKVRVNTIEVTPNARTLGFDIIPPESLVNLEDAMKLVVNKVGKRIRKAYQHYTILF